jgi:RNA polymerase-binding transcription factor DksA
VPSDTVLATVRAHLEDERDHLRRQLDDLGVGGALTFDEGFADSGQVAAEQGEAKLLATTLSDQLREVVGALAKLEAGDYGRCEVCGGEIAEPRLEAMPATRFCIDHA